MNTLFGCKVDALEITKRIMISSVDSFFEMDERGQNGRENRYKWRRREDNSLGIYTLFIHLMDGEFLKLMSKEEYSILL